MPLSLFLLSVGLQVAEVCLCWNLTQKFYYDARTVVTAFRSEEAANLTFYFTVALYNKTIKKKEQSPNSVSAKLHSIQISFFSFGILLICRR
jgi:hypothetical protein